MKPVAQAWRSDKNTKPLIQPPQTNSLLPIMKTFFILIIGAVVGFFFLSSSCSEKSKASVKALKSQAEDQLASFAGEGDVALELMKNQYQQLKERLVKIKTLQRTMERRAKECEATASRMKEEGKSSAAERQQQLAERYRGNITKLAEKEIGAEEALKGFAVEYRDFRDQITVLKEEIASVKAMGGLSDGLATDSPFNERMETVRELEGKLRTKLDRAESLVEVNEIESDL